MTTASQLLQNYFERKKQSQPSFSVRSWARVMKVSPSFVSGLLTGKKPIPLARLPQLKKILELDTHATHRLRSAVMIETLKETGASQEDIDLAIGQHTAIKTKPVNKYKLTTKSQFSVLTPWYNLALLDFTTCAGFKKDHQWIAERLGLSRYQVAESLRLLIAHGLLAETATGYKKVQSKIRWSLNESHREVRLYHRQMIDKAKAVLGSADPQKNFEKREITGITVTANPKNITKARLRLIEALHEVAEILNEGEDENLCSELYQINAQLFSLLTSENK